MTPRKVAEYGTFKSPIEPQCFAAPGSVVLNQLCVNRDNGKIYLLEVRPDEGGRGVIVEHYNGQKRDVLPKQYNCLSQVHEYGGASFVFNESTGHIIFTDWETKGVFGLDPEAGETIPILKADPKVYYADFAIHPHHSQYTVAIKEDHHASKIADIQNSLVVIDSSTNEVRPLVTGSDFYTYPRFSPDGTKICWIQWNHPNMPWDNTELWLADWEDGKAKSPKCIVGQQTKASITQPRWGDDGVLYFVSDQTDFWQLYSFSNGEVQQLILAGLEDAEFGFADWFLGGSSYCLLDPSTMVAVFNYQGRCTTILADTRTLEWRDLSCTIVEIMLDALKPVSDTSFAIIGATPTIPMLATVIDINEQGLGTILQKSTQTSLPEDYVSLPQAITFPRIHGPGGGNAYGLFYPPKNPQYEAPAGTLPPLIVAVHGGPTFQEGPGFSLRDQALTTRGYALVQVNHVGSTGYGRPYRNLLAGQWGVSDIADAVSAVEYLAQQGLVDKSRVGITGHSAGGYATMQALAKYPSVWACGVAESGISDMKLLVEETHKFESQYLSPLCYPPGTSPAEQEAILKDRSPLTHASEIKSPLLIISGADDAIVPPNQAYNLAKIVKEAGAAVDIKVYDGEGHIFNKGSTLSDIERRRYEWFAKYLTRATSS
ncbi:uncharacterized protein A1O5_11070 [Cladophialophora psammophila CBS 110553]|uniref:Peptidase S9 prolyl oligopeptidase catalytic domain-containing protein n=1 Tax=Cladophialophora psammophila CBS 110553 TaxID=1182543 RepID=W9X5X5_9EURO|nr:uncharacterized protein A1O5_11070 [Cladophialophora psammophila CBS 110553]EXJ65829.1 hypothetical protein A1O5_11070 [Cladophialophora psammophila CBS 110553]